MSRTDKYDDDSNFLNYEFSLIPIDDMYRARPPLVPTPGGVKPPGTSGPSFPTPGSGGGYNPGGYNPGNFQPPGMPPIGPPPSYNPAKNEKGVQSLNSSSNQSSTKAVSPNSISFCLYQYTYIWETSGRSYWVYLMYVDRVSVSGFKWMGRYWAYFGLDLRRIDSFVCYRDSNDDCCDNSIFSRSEDNTYESIKLEYTLEETREVYSKILVSLDIPEAKEDFLLETIGVVEGKNVQSKLPCIKTRTTTYRTIIEVSYPETLDESIKDQINSMVDEASVSVYNSLFTTRSKEKYFNPLELYNQTINFISDALKLFSTNFIAKIQKLPNGKEILKQITYTIRREKNSSKWTPK